MMKVVKSMVILAGACMLTVAASAQTSTPQSRKEAIDAQCRNFPQDTEPWRQCIMAELHARQKPLEDQIEASAQRIAAEQSAEPMHVDCSLIKGAQVISIMAEPRSSAKVVTKVECGAEVRALSDGQNGWTRIATLMGIDGYIGSTLLREGGPGEGVDRVKYPFDVLVQASRSKPTWIMTEMAVQIWDETGRKGYTIGCSSSSEHCAHLFAGTYPGRWHRGKLEIVTSRADGSKVQKWEYAIVAENCETPFTCK
jgi:hypothetical protein